MKQSTLPIFTLLILLQVPLWGLAQQDRQFAPCPKSPNCVSTQEDSTDRRHYFPPIVYGNIPWEDACGTARRILERMKGVTIVETAPGYFKTEYRVPFFGFIDDFEVWLPQDKNVVHLRSASRKGYSDMGANRSRAKSFAKEYLFQYRI